MDLKLLLLAVAMIGAVRSEYDYNSNNNNNNNDNNQINNNINNNNVKLATSNGIRSNSDEDYQNNYLATQPNDQNSQATPPGYDYNTQQVHAASSSPPLFPQPLPVLQEQRKPEVFAPATYSYNYAVNDESTGDIKDHQETRDGYVVRGSYSLLDPDGYKRTVTYTADNVNGFKAVVNRVPFVLKKLAVTPSSLALDERAPVGQVSALSSEAASAKTPENTQKPIAVDSYINAVNNLETRNGVYA